MLTRALASIIQAPTARPWQVWWSDTATRLTDQMQTLEIYQSIRSSSKRRKSTGRLYCTIAVDAKSGCKIQINSWTSAQRQKMTWRDNGEKNDEIMRNYLTTFITAANGKTLPSTSSVPQKQLKLRRAVWIRIQWQQPVELDNTMQKKTRTSINMPTKNCVSWFSRYKSFCM